MAKAPGVSGSAHSLLALPTPSSPSTPTLRSSSGLAVPPTHPDFPQAFACTVSCAWHVLPPLLSPPLIFCSQWSAGTQRPDMAIRKDSQTFSLPGAFRVLVLFSRAPYAKKAKTKTKAKKPPNQPTKQTKPKQQPQNPPRLHVCSSAQRNSSSWCGV